MAWIAELGAPPITHALPELCAGLRAADLASEEAMRIYESGDMEVLTKPDDSPVTKADLSCNRIISSELGKTPHVILSEESSDDMSRLDASSVWIVDPLDGTADFVDRTDEFTIMMGLVHDGRPVLGIIAQPAARRIFVAQDGAGSYQGINGTWRRVRVAKGAELDECRAVCSRNHPSDTDKAIISRLGITNMTRMGSSLKVCSVAAGDADVYVTTTNKMKEWDTCASWCIVTEAGGRMTDALGGELTYNAESVMHKHGIIASIGGRIHELVCGECRAVLDQIP